MSVTLAILAMFCAMGGMWAVSKQAQKYVTRLQNIADYLNEWEQSYGFGEKSLPDHWSTATRIDTLRALVIGEPNR